MLKLLKKKISTKKINKKKFKKTIFRVKKLFNTTFLYQYKKLSIINKIFNWIKLKAIIRVTANNIFCTILQEKKNYLCRFCW